VTLSSVELRRSRRRPHCARKKSKTRLLVDIGSIRSRDIVRRAGHLARPGPEVAEVTAGRDYGSHGTGLAIIYGRCAHLGSAEQDRSLPGARQIAAVAFLAKRRRRVQRSVSDVASRRHLLIYSRPSRNANCCSGQEQSSSDVFFSSAVVDVDFLCSPVSTSVFGPGRRVPKA